MAVQLQQKYFDSIGPKECSFTFSLNMGNPRPLFAHFRSFQTILQNNDNLLHVVRKILGRCVLYLRLLMSSMVWCVSQYSISTIAHHWSDMCLHLFLVTSYMTVSVQGTVEKMTAVNSVPTIQLLQILWNMTLLFKIPI